MPKVDLYNVSGKVIGDIELKDEIFNAEINTDAMYLAVESYLANQRQGTKSTLTRSEVRGHAKKPWRQKGTGRARQGSTKGPQWRGGGIVFAPKPRDFSKKVNKEAKRVAFKSAISAKLAQKEIVVLDDLTLKEAKTKLMQKVYTDLGLNKNVLFVTKGNNENVIKASANIQNIDVTTAGLLNVYDIIVCDKLVLTKDAVKQIEEAYAE